MSPNFGFKILKTTRVIRNVYILNGQPSYTLFYATAIRRMRKGIKRCPCPSVHASVCASVRPSFKWVLCERNSSYNFIPILLKLYRCFCQGLKMCMTFGYSPKINFCHFFHSLNLVIFGLCAPCGTRGRIGPTPPSCEVSKNLTE